MRMSFNSQNYKFSTGEHHNKNVIFVHFTYDLLLKNELKEKFPSVKWSETKKCWYIDSKRMLVHLEAAKGKKDRYVTLPSSILDDLRNYYKIYHPKTYLFEGLYGGQYSIRSVQTVFQTAMKKAKINKSVGIHGLRHSYATHLLECGTDMVFIQKLLGHNDIKTTEIYAKVSNRQLGNVKSPLDDL